MSDEKKYPVEKDHDLTETEKDQIRSRIQSGDADIYKLAKEFDCTSSQIAGIKAALKRSGT